MTIHTISVVKYRHYAPLSFPALTGGDSRTNWLKWGTLARTLAPEHPVLPLAALP